MAKLSYIDAIIGAVGTITGIAGAVMGFARQCTKLTISPAKRSLTMNGSSLVPVLVVAMMVGCAHDAGVIPIGNGTFMISKSEWGIEHTGATVKADALKEAGAFCMKQQKDLEVVSTSQQDMVPFKSEAQAEVEFRCH